MSEHVSPLDQLAYAQGYKDFPNADDRPNLPDAYKAGFFDALTLAETERVRLEVLERRRIFAGGVLERKVGFV